MITFSKVITQSMFLSVLSILSFVQVNGQNVGIGTINPLSHLDVQTAADISGIASTQSSGNGNAIDAKIFGTGYAGNFQIFNVSSNKAVINAATTGTGPAGYFYISNAANNNASIQARTGGTGPAGNFEIANPANNFPALLITTNGIGKAADLSITNSNSPASALFVKTIGTGTAGDFLISNTTSPAIALSANTNGTGSAGSFLVSNILGTGHGVSSLTNGLGRAGSFTIANAGNTGYAVFGTTNGPGYGGYFINNCNTASAVRFGMAGYATGAGASSTNIGGFFTAANAAHNYAAIFANGDVGIGTTNPNEVLEIASTGGRFITSDGGGADRRVLLFKAPVAGTDYGRIEAYGYGTSGLGKVLAINNVGGGNVGIATSSPDQQLSVNGGASKSGGGAWSTFSDQRMKKNISPFKDGLSLLTQIQPVNFQYNGLGGYKDDGRKYVGVIAQDIQKIAPYMIEVKNKKLNDADMSNTDLLMYDPSALTYILVNAVKEQQQMIKELQQKILKLESAGQKL